MSFAFGLIIRHILLVLEHRLSNKVESLILYMPIGWSSLHREDVWLAVLKLVSY